KSEEPGRPLEQCNGIPALGAGDLALPGRAGQPPFAVAAIGRPLQVRPPSDQPRRLCARLSPPAGTALPSALQTSGPDPGPPRSDERMPKSVPCNRSGRAVLLCPAG